MRFYNVDIKGKFFNQRGSADPSTDPSNEGRLFYNETSELLKIHNSSIWDSIITVGNATSLIGSDFLRKDQADNTAFALGVGSLLSAGAVAAASLAAVGAVGGASLVISGASATVNGSQVWTAGNDGPGSGLNADLLDNQSGSYYRNAGNLNAGTLPVARLSGTYNINITGSARYA